MGVNPDLDYLLDEQQVNPVGFCPVCLSEIYAYDGICLRCLRRAAADDGE